MTLYLRATFLASQIDTPLVPTPHGEAFLFVERPLSSAAVGADATSPGLSRSGTGARLSALFSSSCASSGNSRPSHARHASLMSPPSGRQNRAASFLAPPSRSELGEAAAPSALRPVLSVSASTSALQAMAAPAPPFPTEAVTTAAAAGRGLVGTAEQGPAPPAPTGEQQGGLFVDTRIHPGGRGEGVVAFTASARRFTCDRRASGKAIQCECPSMHTRRGAGPSSRAPNELVAPSSAFRPPSRRAHMATPSGPGGAAPWSTLPAAGSSPGSPPSTAGAGRSVSPGAATVRSFGASSRGSLLGEAARRPQARDTPGSRNLWAGVARELLGFPTINRELPMRFDLFVPLGVVPTATSATAVPLEAKAIPPATPATARSGAPYGSTQLTAGSSTPPASAPPSPGAVTPSTTPEAPVCRQPTPAPPSQAPLRILLGLNGATVHVSLIPILQLVLMLMRPSGPIEEKPSTGLFGSTCAEAAERVIGRLGGGVQILMEDRVQPAQ